jgi:ParB-like chromosome segregation protein Spo0J
MDEIKRVRISSIKIGKQFRQDMGDLEELAESIKECLLQPIGVTSKRELVFGYRRLTACRDILGWKTIPARTVNVQSILSGMLTENVMRKDFTVSERVAIFQAIKEELGDRQGQRTDLGTSDNFPEVEPGQRTDEFAAKRSGLGNRKTAAMAESVVTNGTPKLVQAMDSGEISISAAAEVAGLTKKQQKEVLRECGQGKLVARQVRAYRHGQDEVGGEDGKRDSAAKDYWQNKKNGTADHPLKVYPTPQYITETLLARETFHGSILEPASGDGSMAAVLRSHGYQVRATDIANGHDFFRRRTKANNIVTNPPYAQSTAEQFVRHAMKIARKKIAMLLPFYFLEGVQRHDLFTSREWPVKAVYIFSRRPTFGEEQECCAPFGTVWVVWAKSHRTPPSIEWVLDSQDPDGISNGDGERYDA